MIGRRGRGFRPALCGFKESAVTAGDSTIPQPCEEPDRTGGPGAGTGGPYGRPFCITCRPRRYPLFADGVSVAPGIDGAPKPPPVKIDFTGLTPIGACPKCGGKVFETEAAYLFERAQADKKPCKFKISRMILQQPIAREQAQKLLTSRKTDLLDKFISKAGKPFPAYLVMDDAGKVTFEFPPREGEGQNS